MPSLSRKPNSPYFMGKFRDDAGRIVMRNTKQTESKKAQVVVDAWEESARKARGGELTRSTALKVLLELVETTTGELLIDATVISNLNGWLESRMVKPEKTKHAVGPKADVALKAAKQLKEFFETGGVKNLSVGEFG